MDAPITTSADRRNSDLAAAVDQALTLSIEQGAHVAARFLTGYAIADAMIAVRDEV